MGCQSGKQSGMRNQTMIQDPVEYGRKLVNELLTIEIQIEQLRTQMYRESDIEYEKSEFTISFDFDYNTVLNKSYKRNHNISTAAYIQKKNELYEQFTQILPSLLAFTAALKKKHYKYQYQMQIEEVSHKLKYKYSEINSYLNPSKSSKNSILSKDYITPINSSDTFQTENNDAQIHHQAY